MNEDIKQSGAGPFQVGDRVQARAFNSAGTVTEVGETTVIRAFDGGTGPGELRAVTAYTVRLDYGIERNIMDRDGHLVPAYPTAGRPSGRLSPRRGRTRSQPS